MTKATQCYACQEKSNPFNVGGYFFNYIVVNLNFYLMHLKIAEGKEKVRHWKLPYWIEIT